MNDFVLKDILDQLRCINTKTVSDIVTGTYTTERIEVTTDGNIPEGAVAYKITNLGDGTNANHVSWTFDGDTIPATIQFISDSLPAGNTFPQLDYIVNGNTLFVEYTTIV